MMGMERIRPLTGAATAGLESLPSRRPAGGFSVPADRAAGPASEVAGVSLGGLLALQEAEAEPAGDRQARRRGRRLLDELAALQRDLLGGEVTEERLATLAALLADVPPAADPDLRAAVAAVALRARLELARYGRG
jgi:hypothetical protein